MVYNMDMELIIIQMENYLIKDFGKMEMKVDLEFVILKMVIDLILDI